MVFNNKVTGRLCFERIPVKVPSSFKIAVIVWNNKRHINKI